MTSDDAQFFEDASKIAHGYLSRLGSDVPIEHSYLDAADAYRFFLSVRGGASIIVGRDGTFLFANSSVPPTKHEEAFLGGRRTDPAVFENGSGSTQA